ATASTARPEYWSECVRECWRPCRVSPRAARGTLGTLVGDADTVFECRFPFCIHWDLELRRPRGALVPLVRRANHPPRSPQRLVHFDRDGHRLVVPNRDLVLQLVDICRDPLEVGLPAVCDGVHG